MPLAFAPKRLPANPLAADPDRNGTGPESRHLTEWT